MDKKINYFKEDRKELIAEDRSNYKVTLLPISDINVTTVTKTSNTTFKYPIVVITKEIQRALTGKINNKKYQIIFGMSDLAKAIKNGYTHIEAHVLNTEKSYNHDRRKLKRLFK